MKLLNNIFLTIILTSFAFTQQGKNLALDYEKALRLTNANEALKIYESIINTNEDKIIVKKILFDNFIFDHFVT